MTACEQCTQPGQSCGTATVSEQAAPCVGGCGGTTAVRSACGAARTFVCGGPGLPEPPPGVRGWHVARHRQLAADLIAAGCPAHAVNDGVELWLRTMRGINWQGAHRTAQAILNGGLRHHKIPPLGLVELTPGQRDALALSEAMGAYFRARAWLTPVPGTHVLPQVRLDLVATDVNGAYLSAAAIELGTGHPEAVERPTEATLRLPGYVRVDAYEDVPHGAAERLHEGMWVPCPTALEWTEQGATLLMGAAAVWTQHRRWLDPHVELIRGARATLMATPGPAAAAVLDLLKGVWTRMFGGLLRSRTHNQGPTLRLDWSDMINATAQARMLRAAAKAQAAGAHLVGVHVDACWWLVRQGEPVPGLEFSTQLGKFKESARVPWSGALAVAYSQRDHETLRAAVAA